MKSGYVWPGQCFQGVLINPLSPKYPHTDPPVLYISYISLEIIKFRDFKDQNICAGVIICLIKSRDHFSWKHLNIVRRKLMFVTIGTYRVKDHQTFVFLCQLCYLAHLGDMRTECCSIKGRCVALGVRFFKFAWYYLID